MLGMVVPTLRGCNVTVVADVCLLRRLVSIGRRRGKQGNQSAWLAFFGLPTASRLLSILELYVFPSQKAPASLPGHPCPCMDTDGPFRLRSARKCPHRFTLHNASVHVGQPIPVRTTLVVPLHYSRMSGLQEPRTDTKIFHDNDGSLAFG